MMQTEALLTPRVAAIARNGILALSIASLVAVFQPSTHWLFKVGWVSVFLSAILFNLMPVLSAGTPWRSVAKTAAVIAIVVLGLASFAVLSAWGYVLYVQAR